MCGLVGMMGDLTVKHRDVMNNLLYLDTLRGMDSTGVAAVSRNRTVNIRKMTVPGYEFVQMPFINTLMGAGDQLWLGHNRYRTKGNINRLNAHPFEVIDEDDKISTIGAHNGTLENQWHIEAELNNRKFGTDSEALINLIDEVGPKAAIAEAKGAWSLVWWNAADNELCFLRNDKRPMFFAYTEDRKVLIWASEVWMILAACNRNGVKLETNDNGLSVYSTSIDTLYTFAIPQDKSAIAPPKKEGGLLGMPEKAPFQAGSYVSLWDGIDDDDKPKSQTAAQTPKAGETTASKGNIVPIGWVKGFNGTPISPRERDAVADKGCGWCGGNLDKAKMAYIAKDEAVCPKCVTASEALIIDKPRETLSVKKG